jgi:anti-anti-sigma factor
MVPLEFSRAAAPEAANVLVLRIGGDVDYLKVPTVEAYMAEALRAEQPRHVLLDLSGLTFFVTPS